MSTITAMLAEGWLSPKHERILSHLIKGNSVLVFQHVPMEGKSMRVRNRYGKGEYELEVPLAVVKPLIDLKIVHHDPIRASVYLNRAWKPILSAHFDSK